MWRQKRKAIVIAVFLMITILVVFFKALPKILPVATCDDGRKNQMELDIDCGGECQKVCQSEYLPITVELSKAIKMDSGYKIFGLLKNPNANFRPQDIAYTFYIYDKSGNKKEIKNTTKVPIGAYIPIIVENYQSEEIVKVNLVVGDYVMQRIQDNKKDFSVVLKDFIFENGDLPKIQIFYESPYRLDMLSQFSMVTILKDKNNNVVKVEKTSIQGLYANTVADFYLSFQERFPSDIAGVMLIPVIYE